MILQKPRDIIVYTSGPYTADTNEQIQRNILSARQHAIQIWEHGYTALCPHLNTAHMERDCSIDYEAYMEGDIALIARCDVIYTLPGWQQSKGAVREVKEGARLKKHIAFSISSLDAIVAKILGDGSVQRGED